MALHLQHAADGVLHLDDRGTRWQGKVQILTGRILYVVTKDSVKYVFQTTPPIVNDTLVNEFRAIPISDIAYALVEDKGSADDKNVTLQRRLSYLVTKDGTLVMISRRHPGPSMGTSSVCCRCFWRYHQEQVCGDTVGRSCFCLRPLGHYELDHMGSHYHGDRGSWPHGIVVCLHSHVPLIIVGVASFSAIRLTLIQYHPVKVSSHTPS